MTEYKGLHEQMMDDLRADADAEFVKAIDRAIKKLEGERFFEGYAKRSGLTVQRLREMGQDVYPCDCDADNCQGWQVLSKEASERIPGLRQEM